MTYKDFRLHLARAGVTAREFAALLHMNGNSVSNYAAANRVPGHLAVIATLMAEMAEHELDFRRPLHAVRIEPKKPRGARKSALANSGVFRPTPSQES